jgi:type II secretory pathway component GspD/PulD (secretin)
MKMLTTLLLFLLLSSHVSFAAETVMEIIPLYNRPAAELHPIISPMLEQSERMIANGSKLIVKATPKRLNELRRLIKQLDARLNNLAITVLQSRTKTARGLNASANIRLQTKHSPSKLSGHIGGRFAQTEGFNNSDSTQVVRTLEGQAATIRTGKVYPVQNISIYDSGYGQPSVSSNTQFIEATTGFIVTPRLTGNQVTLQITPWSDNLNNRGSFDSHGANTTLRINLAEWVEIGGVDEQSQGRRNGTLSHSYSTSNKHLRILIKVDKE